MVDVLEQNPNMLWPELVGNVSVVEEKPSDTEEIATNENKVNSGSDDLASFKL